MMSLVASITITAILLAVATADTARDWPKLSRLATDRTEAN